MRYQYPFRGKMRVTCVYGKPGKWSAGWHIGSDIVGGDNKTIYPIAEGVVESINAHGKAYGNHVCVKHPDGNVSLYAHMSKVSVKVGQSVGLDTPLGLMGATGNANGAHLHLELHQGAYKYPRGYKPKTAPWLLDPVAWIEDHIKGDYQVSKLTIIKDGQPVEVNAVNIDGSNYVKLQDLPKLADVSIGYNGQPTVTTGRAKFSAYDYDYLQTVGNKHHTIRVWEIAPERLRADAAQTDLNTVQHDYLLNAGYSWWTDAAHKQPYGLVLGWHPDKQRVIVAGYDKMSAARGRDLLLELGCTSGITLDGGGSALMREAGKDVLTSDGRYQFGCVWVEM